MPAFRVLDAKWHPFAHASRIMSVQMMVTNVRCISGFCKMGVDGTVELDEKLSENLEHITKYSWKKQFLDVSSTYTFKAHDSAFVSLFLPAVELGMS